MGGQGEAYVADADVLAGVGKRTAARCDHDLVSQPSKALCKLKQMRFRAADAKAVDDEKDFHDDAPKRFVIKYIR